MREGRNEVAREGKGQLVTGRERERERETE